SVRPDAYQRTALEAAVSNGRKSMGWILSDPRGYTQTASDMNARNEDFRRAAKIIKGWRRATKNRYADFAMKSFHIEQAVYAHFSSNPSTTIFDAVFEVMRSIPSLIRKAQFRDRANGRVFIDAYVESLETPQRDLIEEAADYFLMQLEQVKDEKGISSLFTGGRYRRPATEEFLFDKGIPTLVQSEMRIVAKALQGNGFPQKILDAVGWIAKSRHIEFRVREPAPECDYILWKVRNDNSSSQPRGEITKHHTQNDPERTAYFGRHYVEAYAILAGVCIARARQEVVLQTQHQAE
ncbi:hypothetical protein HPO_19357, partial [Hyphomonas polymorpha PS728]